MSRTDIYPSASHIADALPADTASVLCLATLADTRMVLDARSDWAEHHAGLVRIGAAVAESGAHHLTPIGEHARLILRHRHAQRRAADANALPVRPCAEYVRAQLRKVELEHLVEKVTTGHKRCRVHLVTGPDKATAEQDATQAAEALRMLWHDGDQRVQVNYRWLIEIDKADWYHTGPNTREGLQYLETRENDRTTSLTLAQKRGQHLATSDSRSVRYEPSNDAPHHPWIDLAHSRRRYTPFQVFAY